MEENQEISVKLLCMACLCVGRTLRNITDEKLKRFYLDTLEEIPLYNVSIINIHVCWECEAIIKKAVLFRDQVQDSYRILQTYPTENFREVLLSDIVRPPRLSKKTVSIISVSPKRRKVGKKYKDEVKSEDGKDTSEDSDSTTADNDNVDALDVEIETLVSKAQEKRSKNLDRCPLSGSVSPNPRSHSPIIIDTEYHEENVKDEKRTRGKSKGSDGIPSDSDDVDALDVEIETLVSKAQQKRSKVKHRTRKTTRSKWNGLKNLDRCPLSGSVSPNPHTENSAIVVETRFITEELKVEDVDKESSTNVSKAVDVTKDNIEAEIAKLISKSRKKTKIKSKIKKSKKEVKRLQKGLKTKKRKKLDDQKIITVELTYEQMWAEREKEAEREAYINAPYKCESCLMGFSVKNSYKAHISAKHSPEGGDYICPICSSILSSVDSFTAHYKRHLRRYECSVCQKRTMDLKTMQQHYYSTHEISVKEYKCDVCGKISNSIDTHRYHKDTHKARVQCTECDKTFTHRAGLLNHKLSVHELNNAFPCTICEKVFRWKTSLKRHLEKHDDKDKSSTAAYCALCGVTFASVCSYQRHMRNSLRHVSPEQLRYICDHCKRRFADKTKLRDHIEEKHLHKTYQCHICMKPSKNRVGLDQHIRNVHKGRPNNKLCHHCGKGFPTKVQLESHIRTHTGERPFCCDFCPTTFSQLSNLYKHNRQVHSNVKAKRYPPSKKKKEDRPPDPPVDPPLDPYRPAAVLQYSPERGFVM